MVGGAVGVFIFLVLAPAAGGLLAGLDRILTARLQSRVGPPLLQPFHDVRKLLGKRPLVVTRFQEYWVWCCLLFVAVAGGIFFAGGDILLAVFALTVGGVCLVMAAYAAGSPYSQLGASREMLLMMAIEPVLIIAALGVYLAGHSFEVREALAHPGPLAARIPLVVVGLVLVLSIKLRKSPFDLAASHHAHQELVRGLTTEFSGPTLALVEIAHWYEQVLLLGFIGLCFAGAGPAIAAAAVAGSFLLVVLADNSTARLTWPRALGWSWGVAGLGGLNILALHYGPW